MRALAVILLLAACGCDTDIHAMGDCDAAWVRNGFTECEAACESSTTALGATGPACQAHASTGPVSCSKTFEFEGVTGCCVAKAPQLLFGECD